MYQQQQGPAIASTPTQNINYINSKRCQTLHLRQQGLVIALTAMETNQCFYTARGIPSLHQLQQGLTVTKCIDCNRYHPSHQMQQEPTIAAPGSTVHHDSTATGTNHYINANWELPWHQQGPPVASTAKVANHCITENSELPKKLNTNSHRDQP